MNIINFKNIDIGYDGTKVLEDLTLNIQSGEHWAILGANGSGKSTLMKLIQSEIHPMQNGKFTKEILGKSRYSIFELKDQLGIITNDLHNYFMTTAPNLTGYEVTLSGYYSSGGIFEHQKFTQEQYDQVVKTMQYLGISHLKDTRVHTMSTGELRRCIIARALIHNPVAFILDEPTVGLDIKAQAEFLTMLKQVAQTSSVIIVTHHLEEIFSEITHVALLHKNKIYKQGKKKEILTSENLSHIFDIPLTLDSHNDRYFIREIETSL